MNSGKELRNEDFSDESQIRTLNGYRVLHQLVMAEVDQRRMLCRLLFVLRQMNPATVSTNICFTWHGKNVHKIRADH